MSFGKATLSNNGYAFFTVKAGDRGETGHNIYRVLPSYGKLEKSGQWSIFYGQHFGYSIPSQNGKPRAAPFKCVREVDRKTEMVLVECPECVSRESMMAKRDSVKAQLVTEGADEATIKSALKEYNEWLKSHNLDKSFYVAAMNQKNEFGILKLKYEAFKELEKKVKDLLATQQTHALLLDQGCWFDFQRTGEYLDTKYAVDYVYDSIVGEKGRRYMELKLAPISAEDADRAEAALPELVDLPNVVTVEQVAKLVACSGDPDEVEAIMGVSKKKGTQAKAAQTFVPTPAAETAVGSPVPQAIRQTAPAAVQTVSPVQTQAPTAQVETDEEREFREFKAEKARKAKLALEAAAPAASSAAPVTSAPEVASAPVQQTLMGGPGEDAFLKRYGFGGAKA